MKKNLNYYLELEYTIRLKKNSDGSYFAEVEELPGCMTEGDTEQEAVTMIEDAKKAWLEVALKRKIAIPEPASDEFSGKFNIRVPKFLHRKLAYKAKQENVSLNTLITTTLASAIK
jgi:antitoxin HicB